MKKLVSILVGLSVYAATWQEASAQAADEKPAIPLPMTLTGILVKGKVVRVSDSQQRFTENSWTEVSVKLSHVYRGEQKVGEEMRFCIDGWMGSEKAEAEFYRKAKSQSQEVIIPLAKVYNPFLKCFNNNYGGNIYTPSGKPFLATDENMSLADKAAAIPIGWNYYGKQLISPWSAVDKAAFQMKDTNAVTRLVCAKTGRPGYLTDPRLELRADLLRHIGGGYIFGISITNPTDQPIKIESLRSSAGKILGNESILFVNGGRVWLPVGFDGFTENTEATVIQPGQTLKAEMPWTAQFNFNTLICLGNKSFSIYINCASSYESKLYPKPPFQKPPAKSKLPNQYGSFVVINHGEAEAQARADDDAKKSGKYYEPAEFAQRLMARNPERFGGLIPAKFALQTKLNLSSASLDIDDSLDKDDMVSIGKLVFLESLNLASNKRIDTEMLRELQGLQKLTSLNLSWVLWHKESSEVTAALAQLKNLKSLRELTLYQTDMGDEAFAYLREIPALRSLKCSGFHATDESLAALEELSQLEYLALDQAYNLKGSGFSHLRKLDKLWHLSLNENTLSPEALTHIGKLTSLKELSLWSTTGFGVPELEALTNLVNLKSLNLSRPYFGQKPFTENNVAKLKKALPDCKIKIHE